MDTISALIFHNPHAEGLAESCRFFEGLTELPDEPIRTIMGENARRMLFSE